MSNRNEEAGPEQVVERTLVAFGSRRESLAIVVAVAMLMALGYVVEAGWKRYVLGGFASVSRDVIWMAPLSAMVYASLLLAPVWLAAPWMRAQVARASALFAAMWLATFAALLPWTQIHRVAAAVLAMGVASAIMRWCTTRRRVQAVVRIGQLIGITLLVAGACSVALQRYWQRAAYAALPSPATDAPNVLVLLLDTVRASELGMYGYPRATSPAMDSVAAGGVVFEHAVSTAPWTLPAHASLFTGEYPGVLSTSFRAPLDGKYATLAERFGAAGYETVGFVGNPYYTAWDSGLNRGFLRWFDFNPSVKQVLRSGWIGQSSIVLQLMRSRSLRNVIDAFRSAEFVVIPKPGGDAPDARELTDALLGWQAARDTRPFFAFVNFFDAHEAYAPPPAYRTRFTENPKARDLHDGEIAYVDDQVKRLLESLRSRGALANTIVVITSDHGEQFKEHGISGHGNSLFYQLLHIPLVFRYDGHVPVGRRVPFIVSLRDVGATLLDLAGASSDLPFPGRSLVATWTSSDSIPPARSAAISELTQDRVPRTDDPLTRSQGISLVEDDGMHGIFRNLKQIRPLLFNVRTDAAERVNLAKDSAGRTAYDAQQTRLRRLLLLDTLEVARRGIRANKARILVSGRAGSDSGKAQR
ncbi:MAG: sulfatase-like hydrolase/transferase [Gemmatimonadota bacterium]